MEYLKSPALATFFTKSNPILAHLEVLFALDAIHFERFYRLYSCHTVTNNSARLCGIGL